MEPMRPEDTTTTSNGEEQLATPEGTHRAREQADRASVGRGGASEPSTPGSGGDRTDQAGERAGDDAELEDSQRSEHDHGEARHLHHG